VSALLGGGDVRIRTIETDPIPVDVIIENGIWAAMSTTVRVQVRLWGHWITLLKWEKVC